jgi:hypothetical protein
MNHFRDLEVVGEAVLKWILVKSEIEYYDVAWIHLAQGTVLWRALLKSERSFTSHKREFLEQLSGCCLLREDFCP